MIDNNSYDQLFEYAKTLGFGEMHIKIDAKSGLLAFIAIHSTKLGPAIGGCRFLSYPSVEDAMSDAFRLARMMSYKAAVCGLPHGGGKSVIVRDNKITDRKALFSEFGKFVDSMNGRYIAAVDSGTSSLDMDIIAQETKFASCTSASYRQHGDVSYYTALGVFRGIQAAIEFTFNQKDLHGLHVAIQGIGHVGYYLAKRLHEAGAKLTVTDIDPETVKRAVAEFSATAVAADEIYQVPCDVFAPCALGAILNTVTIPQLNCKIVAGSANNQLADEKLSEVLHERGLLYVPDFVINSGGLIHVAALYDHGDENKAHLQIYSLYDTILGLLRRAKDEDLSPNVIAAKIAAERL